MRSGVEVTSNTIRKVKKIEHYMEYLIQYLPIFQFMNLHFIEECLFCDYSLDKNTLNLYISGPIRDPLF